MKQQSTIESYTGWYLALVLVLAVLIFLFQQFTSFFA